MKIKGKIPKYDQNIKLNFKWRACIAYNAYDGLKAEEINTKSRGWDHYFNQIIHDALGQTWHQSKVTWVINWLVIGRFEMLKVHEVPIRT